MGIIQNAVSFTFRLCLLIGFTILLINDYFPYFILSEVFPTKFTAYLMVVLVIFLLLLPMTWKKKNEREELKETVRFNIFMMIYSVSILIILNLLGGTSQVGITYTNPVAVIVFLITTGQIVRDIRKLKLMNSESNSS
ncbi:hypothetical protein [Caldalkalibacillus mannanilyticus]|uniref:hypothetical protein n=1 Tax=Caldalkalibacillus mannanilyticus TaxID=1418 RepID=UPI000469BE20|nr:hypothetical protein [Caldalkalibacillus mannanilyticus]